MLGSEHRLLPREAPKQTSLPAWLVLIMLAAAAMTLMAVEEPLAVQSEPVHLRSGAEREWASFPEHAHGAAISLTFRSPAANDVEYSLVLRQRDVKGSWTVELNDRELGTLIADERDMVRILPVPAGTLRSGKNALRVTGKAGRFSDDIEIRDLRIERMPAADLLRQTVVDVRVTDERGALPVRITVVDAAGSLVPVTALRDGAPEAIRTGVVYTADGATRIGLPAGDYRIYASRGFEYSAPSRIVRLRPGGRSSIALRIRREVPMTGFVSCDTHVHTLELSGHGDASVDERVLTAAGEGLDLMIVTEHNRAEDYTAALDKPGLRGRVVLVRGSEVTTATGHFNVFPVQAGAVHPDFRQKDWSALLDGIWKTPGVQVVVQNHPRDLHSNYRPFDPSHHISSIGENRHGRPFRANAMEVVNSGAMSSDPLQLVRDWMGLLTRGIEVAAVGASDTHTVDFVPIAQARTYIDISGAGDWRRSTGLAVQQLAEGRNLMSYGLAADARQAGPVRNGSVPVEVTVWGPSWSAADQLTVYSNGIPVWRQKLNASKKPGRKFSKVVNVAIPKHDAAIVAVATGPGILAPFWEVRKPYQPTSSEWDPMVLGVSRAVWVDVDGDGRAQAPLALAERLVQKAGRDVAGLARELAEYDASVTKHALNLLEGRGVQVRGPAVKTAFEGGPPVVRKAWSEFVEELGKIRAAQ